MLVEKVKCTYLVPDIINCLSCPWYLNSNEAILKRKLLAQLILLLKTKQC
jgi:hypothetical protein